MDQSKFDTGLEARRRVLGDEYVDRAFDTADAFNIEFQKLVTEYCWGEVWGRSALSDKQRSLNNLCILASLNRGAAEGSTRIVCSRPTFAAVRPLSAGTSFDAICTRKRRFFTSSLSAASALVGV